MREELNEAEAHILRDQLLGYMAKRQAQGLRHVNHEGTMMKPALVQCSMVVTQIKLCVKAFQLLRQIFKQERVHQVRIA